VAPERYLPLSRNPCQPVGLVPRDECTLSDLPRVSVVRQHAGYCRRANVHVVIDVLANHSNSIRTFIKKQLGLLLDCGEHRLAQLRVNHDVVLVTNPPRRIVVVIAGVSGVRQKPRRRPDRDVEVVWGSHNTSPVLAHHLHEAPTCLQGLHGRTTLQGLGSQDGGGWIGGRYEGGGVGVDEKWWIMQIRVGKTQRPSRRRERSPAGPRALLPLSRTFRRLPSDSLHAESLPSRSHSTCCNLGQCWLLVGARPKKLGHLTADPISDTLIGNDMDYVRECIRAKCAPSRTAVVMTCQRPLLLMKKF